MPQLILACRSRHMHGILTPSVWITFVGIMMIWAIGPVLNAQSVMLPLRHPVYEYLDRLETKYGLNVLQFSRPLPRMEIARALDSLSRFRTLAAYDKKQISFYMNEFAEEFYRLRGRDSAAAAALQNERWNLLRVRTEIPAKNYFVADFVGAAEYIKRTDAEDAVRRSNGIQAWGYVGSSFGAFMRWYDNGETGILSDAQSSRTPRQAIVRQLTSTKPTSAEYEIAEGQCTYTNDWITIGIQKMDQWLGSGRSGSIIMSDKAPSFPRAGFTLRITDWMSFEYSHAWLFSDSLDFDRTYYPTNGGQGAKFYETKYLASHHLVARPLHNLQCTLGESIIYGGGDVSPLMLIPFISFRAADRWTRATTGNSQFFADVRYAPSPGVVVYGTGFVDELDFSMVFTGKTLNADYHVAYTVGATATDLYTSLIALPSESRVEFSRVYPYVYSNPSPTQQYTSHKVGMGHWIGANSDILTLSHVVHPARSVDVGIEFAQARFADPYPVPLVLPRTQPPFLARPLYTASIITAHARWIPWHDLGILLSATHTTLDRRAYFSGAPTAEGLAVGLRCWYGLY